MTAQDGEILKINMQSDMEPGSFGLCYECKSGLHSQCIGVPCACSCPPKDWLVYTTSEIGYGSVYLFWKPLAAGYTRFIEDAGRYTFGEAERYASKSWADGTTGAVRLDSIGEVLKRVLPSTSLDEIGPKPGMQGVPT